MEYQTCLFEEIQIYSSIKRTALAFTIFFLPKAFCVEILLQKNRERISEGKNYVLTVTWKERRDYSIRKWKLWSAEVSKMMWRLYWRGWYRVQKTHSWRVEAGQKMCFGMLICWNPQEKNQGSILIEYEWFIHISQLTPKKYKQKKTQKSFLTFWHDQLHITSLLWNFKCSFRLISICQMIMASTWTSLASLTTAFFICSALWFLQVKYTVSTI